MYPYVHSSIIYNSQDLETAYVLTVDEWIKKMGYIYTVDYYYYLTMKKKEILPFVTAWMDLEIIMLSEIN